MENDILIKKIINDILLRYPLFGGVIARLKFKYTSVNVPTPIFNDGKNIYYKSNFFSDYSYEEQKFLIAHEIFHIILKHLYRNLDKDQDLLNYVEDAIINQMLKKDDFKMPKDAINVEDALLYSVEELYLRFLPQIEEIKKWAREKSYHMDLEGLDALENEIVNSYGNNLEEISKNNAKLRDILSKEYKEELQPFSGNTNLGKKLENEELGEIENLVTWQELLEMSLTTMDTEEEVRFYEIDPDGLFTKVLKSSYDTYETEIIIDSSCSLSIEKLEIILRECKNILKSGIIKIGFCDTNFYGWHEINSSDDIDNLKIIGRGDTSFAAMKSSFTPSAINKIVITDGDCEFPPDCKDIIWVVINHFLPRYCRRKDLKIVFVDSRKIMNVAKLVRQK